MPVTLYHRTPRQNLRSILRRGLQARCEACVGENEGRKGVYLWRFLAAAEGRPFGGRRRLRGNVVIAVTIPDPALCLLSRDNEYFEDETEAYVYPTDIPPTWIEEIK